MRPSGVRAAVGCSYSMTNARRVAARHGPKSAVAR
jgi:hypothetical protein